MNAALKRTLWGVGALVIVAALAFPKLPIGADAEAPTADRGSTDNRLLVRARIVSPAPLEDKLISTGTLLANEEVALTSEVAGKVTDILFEEGQVVQAGALLLKINDAPLQARLEQAQYRLRLAEEREARQRTVLEKGGVSQEAYDALLNEVNVLRAEIELIEAEVDRTEVRAPFRGRIGLRNVSVGTYLTPTMPIASLQDLATVKIDFALAERYAQRIEVGDQITFQVAGVEEPVQGTVYAFEPRVDIETRTVRVRARASNPGERLLPGFFADIEVVFETMPDALTVPSIAVIPELGGKKVFVYENGLAQPRQVTTGIRTAERVQITSGLNPQDTVLVTGIQQLRPGLPVRLSGTEVLVGD